MKKVILIILWTGISVSLFSFSTVNIVAASIENLSFIEVNSIGFPTCEKQLEGRSINDLKFFKGKLYIGSGDAVYNTGRTEVIYWNPKSGTFTKEFTVDDEAIYKYQELDGKLVIPGVDATEDWKFGNVYIHDEKGWHKRRTIPHALHVNSLAAYQGAWYACTGNYFDFSKKEQYTFGGIFRSLDEGKHWKLVFSTPTDEFSVYRVGSIIPFQNKLYSFLYSLQAVKKEDVPKKFLASLGKPFQGEYYIITPDMLGSLDAVTFNGKKWGLENIIPEKEVCSVSPIKFKKYLLLSVLSGSYINYLELDKLPKRAKTILYKFDGSNTTKVDLDYKRIIDVLVKNEHLFLLLMKKGLVCIAETTDLKKWNYIYLPKSLNEIKSIEFDGVSFYLGMKDGNIFKSSQNIPIKSTIELENLQPKKFFGEAVLPREGLWYWFAATDWKKWGKQADFSVELLKGNRINVITKNVAECKIFVPYKQIDATKPIIVYFNNKRSFRGKLRGKTELFCKQRKNGTWKVKKSRGTLASYKYSKKIIGVVNSDLSNKGANSAMGKWVAEKLKEGTGADIAFISNRSLKKSIKKGEISLENIADIIPERKLYSVSTTGKEIKTMLEFNIKLAAINRIQTAGIACKIGTSNEIQKCSLNPNKIYKIVLPKNIMRWSKEYFGKTLLGKKIQQGLLECFVKWFEKH